MDLAAVRAMTLEPPSYSEPSEPQSIEDLPPDELGRGTVVVFKLRTTNAQDWERFAAALPEMRRSFPSSPFGLLCNGLHRADALAAARRAAIAGIRLVLDRPKPRTETVRSQLTDRVMLPTHAVLWLRQMDLLTKSLTADAARKIFQGAATSSTLKAIARQEELDLERLRRNLRRERGPTAVSLLQLARRSYQALELQGTSAPIQTLARGLGYRNPNSFSEAMTGAFGIPPSEVRRIAGFESLFSRYYYLKRQTKGLNYNADLYDPATSVGIHPPL